MIGKMRISNVIAAVLTAALVPMSASATSSLSMVWESAGNTPTLVATQSSVERANILAVGDTAGIGGIFVSFNFDNELTIAPVASIPGCGGCMTPGGREQAESLPGMGNDFTSNLPGYNRNQVAATGTDNTGVLGSYDVTASDTGLISATRTLGSVWFMVEGANIADDGPDLDVVILNDAFDAVLAASGANISSTVLLNSASVVPEPTSVGLGLVALGSLGMLVARKRR